MLLILSVSFVLAIPFPVSTFIWNFYPCIVVTQVLPFYFLLITKLKIVDTDKQDHHMYLFSLIFSFLPLLIILYLYYN